MQDVNDGLNLDRTTYCSIQDILQYYTIYYNITYLEPCLANTPELLNLTFHHSSVLKSKVYGLPGVFFPTQPQSACCSHQMLG